REHLTLYSPHGRAQLALLEHAFEAANPDIDVRWLDMGSQEVLDRLRFEKPNPVADIWFGGPTTIFDRGIREGLIEPYRPVWWRSVDSGGVGPDDMYWPVYRTPAVIAYDTNLVKAADAPKDWNDVLLPRWHDQVLIRDPVASGTMRAIWGMILLRSIRSTGDTAQGMQWLRALDAQTRTYTLNPAILAEKLARGEGTVTLWDLPDLLIWRSQGFPFAYTFPTSGTPVIDDAIAIVKGTRHRRAAERFIDYVGSVDAQILTAEQAWRLPARTDLPADRVPAWVADVDRHMVTAPMDWPRVARDGDAWMRYWDQRVRGSGKAEGAR
ncbi:MAG TPA: extracellular solute-binding protein, partial [Gemmatimonadales bacterium]|nr:extracellular solute-binding protein [Gemmatimonadales bacterium]